jgi:hypothetical protein
VSSRSEFDLATVIGLIAEEDADRAGFIDVFAERRRLGGLAPETVTAEAILKRY